MDNKLICEDESKSNFVFLLTLFKWKNRDRFGE